MSEENCGNLILDAIDQLRKRKARPDLDRICHMLERRHNMSSTEVNEELGRLVKKGAVVKVDYKGSTSYRNAAKWARMKTHFFGSFYNSSDISTVVLEAVSTLTLPLQDQTQLKSASIQDIEQYLLKRDAQSNLNLATLQAVLEKEVLKKTIHRLPSGEFVPLLQNVPSDVSSPEKVSNESLKKDSSSPLHKAVTTDLEDDDMEFDYWSDSYRCDYCLLTSSANRKGEPEALLRCRECNAKAHPSCMEYTLPEDKSVQDIYWKCPDCKTCSVCNGTYPGNCDDLLSCDMCHTDYHMTCHDPKVEIKSIGPWRCGKCEAQSGRFKFTPKKSRFSTSSFEDDIDAAFLRGSFLKSIEQYPVSIPYAHEWSIKNVEAFFNFIGFEEESKAFREQEIDGLSLLLMKRDDVLTGLGIKLGPALKIYNHIKKLQGRVGEATCV